MKFHIKQTAIAVGAALSLSACSSSFFGDEGVAVEYNNDGEKLSTVVQGFSLPSKISAVPSSSATAAAKLAKKSGLSKLGTRDAHTAEGTDFSKDQTARYIEERALNQFDIIESVMKALAQTRYYETANINQGPYTAMVAFEEENNGREQKSLEPWTVDSRMIIAVHPVSGEEVDTNRIIAWIEEEDHGQTRLIKAEFKIFEAANIADNGEVLDYGVWDLNVKFDDTGSNFFAANARKGEGEGEVVLKIHENNSMGEGSHAMKAVLNRSGSTGHGKVELREQWGDQQNEVDASYAYNDAYLAVTVGNETAYKKRNSETEMTHRYGLYFAADGTYGDKTVKAGDNIMRYKSFGFPITYTAADGGQRWGYYGGWQGRHEIWGDGDKIPAGTTVTKENWENPEAAAETYTVSETFNGTFVKRTLVPGSLDDIKGVPVETWMDKHFDLTYDNGSWKFCDGFWDWGTNPPSCQDRDGVTGAVPLTVFDKFDSLVVGDNHRKHVNASRCDNNGCSEYMYLKTGMDGVTADGFYPATWGEQGLVRDSTQGIYTPTTGDQLWINIGGSIYIAYTGDFTSTNATGWVEKNVVGFDEEHWRPEFNGNKGPFHPEMGREYYINGNGVNYIVARIAENNVAADYKVNLEVQTTANPTSVASILPTGTDHLRSPWDKDKTYTLVTDSASANFMKLVVKTDETGNSTVGDVVTDGGWGLQAFNTAGKPLDAAGAEVPVDEWGNPTTAATTVPVQFNWEYSEDGGWGTQQYLLSGTDYVLLSDPVSLAAQDFTNGAGVTKRLKLGFDGWLHGMPDLYRELEKNNWSMSAEISDKIINIPAGTEMTDAGDSTIKYVIKPLEISVFLDPTTLEAITAAGGTAPDTAAGTALTLDVPSFVEHNVGPKPTDTKVKYSEGVPTGDDTAAE